MPELRQNRALTLSGSIIGEVSAAIGSTLSASQSKTFVFATTIPKSFASIQRQQQTLNISSRSAGASFGALPTEQTTTSHSTLKHRAKTLNISTAQQTKDMFRMLSSRHSALKDSFLQFFARLMTRRLSTQRRTIPVL